MLLNNADALRLGAAVVDRVYAGAAQVWPATTATITEHLFPSGAAGRPATLAVFSDPDAGINLGFQFACSVTGTRAVALDAYMAAGVTMRPRLYAASGAVLAQGSAVTAPTDGWYRLPFTTATTLDTGTSYTAATYQAATQKYAAESGRFPATVGPIFNTSSTSSRYGYGAETAPTDAAAFWFGVDLVAETT